MSKKIPKEDPFKLAGVTEDELKKAATIYNETMTTLKNLRRKNTVRSVIIDTPKNKLLSVSMEKSGPAPN